MLQNRAIDEDGLNSKVQVGHNMAEIALFGRHKTKDYT